MRILETCTILAEKEFKKLEDQSNFNKNVDPLKYIGRLVGAVLTFIAALSLLTIDILKFLNRFGLGTESVNPLDILQEYINKQTDEDTFVLIAEMGISTLFIMTAIYFIKATHHGNKTIGQRHAFFTFYAMHENETLLNSFIANISLNNVVSMGAIQYCVMLFSMWGRKSQALKIALYNRNALFHV